MGETSPYYRAPRGVWPDVDGRVWQILVELRDLLARALEPTQADRPTPMEVGFKLNEAAQGIFQQLAPKERDLRQIITTLRTAHALAWDSYDAVGAERTTVAQFMARLREQIDEFEADLGKLQEEDEV